MQPGNSLAAVKTADGLVLQSLHNAPYDDEPLNVEWRLRVGDWRVIY